MPKYLSTYSFQRSTVDAQDLANNHINVIYKVLHDCFNGKSFDELFGEAGLALMKAAYKYDAKNNMNSFLTYAYTCIKLHLFTLLKKEKDIQNHEVLFAWQSGCLDTYLSKHMVPQITEEPTKTYQVLGGFKYGN